MLLAAGANPYFRVDQGEVANARPESRAAQSSTSASMTTSGIARDPEVAAAAKAAIDRYGTSARPAAWSPARSRCIAIWSRPWPASSAPPAAIVFVSGHATNVTTIGHLLGPDDLILHDILAHD